MKRYNDCMEVREDFSAYLDGELSAEEREPLEAHLASCAECLREMDVLKRVDDSYRGLAPVSAPEHFEAGVREAVRTGRRPSLDARRPVPRWMGPIVAMACAAAVLVVGVGVLEWRQGNRSDMHVASAPAAMELGRLGDALMKSKEAESTVAEADSAAGADGAWDNFAHKSASSDTTWEQFAQPAPSAASPVNGGREDSGESLGRALAAADKPDDSAGAEMRARAELIGTPPPVAEENKAPAEKVLDALKDEQAQSEGEQIAPPSAPAQAGDVVSRQKLRSFTVLPGPLWVETGYDHQPTVPLKRKSRELRELMKKNPDAPWDRLLERTARQVFQMGETWYDLEAAPAENP